MIVIKRKVSRLMGTNCYSVSDGQNYVVIDPAVSFEEMDKISSGSICGVLITHGHFDHIDQLQSYLDSTDAAVYGHFQCFSKLQNSNLNCSNLLKNRIEFDLKNRFIDVSDNQMIDLLNGILVKENPGHSDCSVSYIIEKNMFCGDFIFKGSVGRTDLYSGNLNEMLISIEKISKSDIDYNLYPGHGDSTTLYIERETNYYFK